MQNVKSLWPDFLYLNIRQLVAVAARWWEHSVSGQHLTSSLSRGCCMTSLTNLFPFTYMMSYIIYMKSCVSSNILCIPLWEKHIKMKVSGMLRFPSLRPLNLSWHYKCPGMQRVNYDVNPCSAAPPCCKVTEIPATATAKPWNKIINHTDYDLYLWCDAWGGVVLLCPLPFWWFAFCFLCKKVEQVSKPKTCWFALSAMCVWKRALKVIYMYISVILLIQETHN